MGETLMPEGEGPLVVQGNWLVRWHVEGVDRKALIQRRDLMLVPPQRGAHSDDCANRCQQAFSRHGTPPCGRSVRR